MMTRKVTVLTSCLIATFAALAVISALASASMTLPEFSGTAATEGKGSGGAGKMTISGGASLIGTSGTGTYALEPGSRRSGTFTADINGVTQGGEECRSLGDTGGIILVTGSWHLVLWLTGASDKHLILASGHELHIECPKSAVKLLLVSGQGLGSIAALSGSKTEFGVTVKDNGTNQEFTLYENDAGTGIDVTLETSQEGGKQKPSFLEAEHNLLTVNGNTEIIN
jgi:hypothetical protein